MSFSAWDWSDCLKHSSAYRAMVKVKIQRNESSHGIIFLERRTYIKAMLCLANEVFNCLRGNGWNVLKKGIYDPDFLGLLDLVSQRTSWKCARILCRVVKGDLRLRVIYVWSTLLLTDLRFQLSNDNVSYGMKKFKGEPDSDDYHNLKQLPKFFVVQLFSWLNS